MGAWGLGSFENDDAMDWMSDFAEVQDMNLINATFDIVIENAGSYIEAPEASNALAAAEIIAAIKGNIHKDFPDYYLNKSEEIEAELIDFDKLKTGLIEDVSQKALQVVRLIKENENSELKQLWQDTDEFSDWLNDVNELEKRLN